MHSSWSCHCFDEFYFWKLASWLQISVLYVIVSNTNERKPMFVSNTGWFMLALPLSLSPLPLVLSSFHLHCLFSLVNVDRHTHEARHYNIYTLAVEVRFAIYNLYFFLFVKYHTSWVTGEHWNDETLLLGGRVSVSCKFNLVSYRNRNWSVDEPSEWKQAC